jgi:hypothetical protein
VVASEGASGASVAVTVSGVSGHGGLQAFLSDSGSLLVGSDDFELMVVTHPTKAGAWSVDSPGRSASAIPTRRNRPRNDVDGLHLTYIHSKYLLRFAQEPLGAEFFRLNETPINVCFAIIRAVMQFSD